MSSRDRRLTRREFGRTIFAGAGALTLAPPLTALQKRQSDIDERFFVRSDELTLRALQAPASRSLSFANFRGSHDEWRDACKAKLAELIGFEPPRPGTATRLRTIQHAGVTIEAWILTVGESLSMPAYLLYPESGGYPGRAIMAVHGHGRAEPCVGREDDYHHEFALRLAQAGHLVLCPELRGFGEMCDMTRSSEQHWLDYWGSRRGRQFTLVTDSFLFGKTVIGQTIEDLIRWEDWLAQERDVDVFDTAGISYGGDLVITYPVFSNRIERIYTSGSMGSISSIFSRCYNAPAHCIPSILQWMDRSDVAGLNAPSPIRLHYGELDTPGPENASASYNETVEPALKELRAIYRAFDAEDRISLRVTPGRGHEFEIADLLRFMAPSPD